LSDSRLSRPLFWAAAIFAFVMAVLPHPPHVPGEPSDKIQHIAAFLTLGLLGAWAYPAMPLERLLAGLSLFGGLIEVIQALPLLNRDSDILDWLADTVASAFAIFAIRWWRARRG
jgi:VanZ family protein